jgi:hypothetical protein
MSLTRSTCIQPFDFQAILFWPDGLFKEPIPKKNEQNGVNITFKFKRYPMDLPRVADPGSGAF